jgi:hypothetical protein
MGRDPQLPSEQTDLTVSPGGLRQLLARSHLCQKVQRPRTHKGRSQAVIRHLQLDSIRNNVFLEMVNDALRNAERQLQPEILLPHPHHDIREHVSQPIGKEAGSPTSWSKTLYITGDHPVDKSPPVLAVDIDPCNPGAVDKTTPLPEPGVFVGRRLAGLKTHRGSLPTPNSG